MIEDDYFDSNQGKIHGISSTYTDGLEIFLKSYQIGSVIASLSQFPAILFILESEFPIVQDFKSSYLIGNIIIALFAVSHCSRYSGFNMPNPPASNVWAI